jgi:hypothetical protein
VFSLLRQVRRACVRSPFRFVGRYLPFGLFLHDASHADGRRRRKVCDRLVFGVIVEESPHIFIYIYTRRQSAIVVGIECDKRAAGVGRQSRIEQHCGRHVRDDANSSATMTAPTKMQARRLRCPILLIVFLNAWCTLIGEYCQFNALITNFRALTLQRINPPTHIE